MNSILKFYIRYITQHRKKVKEAYEIILPKLKNSGMIDEETLKNLSNNINDHDLSKFRQNELVPYANYFFGEKNQENKEKFKQAAIIHKSRNPHHPEYWMNKKGETQDMPIEYIVEMLCDWWSFGLAQNKPDEIFEYYNRNKDKYKFSKKITAKIDKLLAIINDCILENNFRAEKQ